MVSEKVSEKQFKIKISQFDEIFQYIGGLGLYQVIYVILLGSISLVQNDSIAINFIGADLPHWCLVPELKDLPFNIQKDVSIPYSNDPDLQYSQCRQYNLDYSRFKPEDFINWNRSIMINESTPIVDCRSGWVYDRFEFAETLMSKFDLVCDDNWMIDFLSTLLLGGYMIGAMTSGPLADRFGRRYSLLFFCVLRSFGGFICAFAPSYEVFAVARVVTGTGIMGGTLSCFVLVVETVDPRYRAGMSVISALFYNTGNVLLVMFGYLIRDYQNLLLIPASCSLVFWLYFWFFPESSRWLAANNRMVDAETVFKKIAAVNGRDYPENLDFTPLIEDMRKQRLEADSGNKRTVLDLFKTPLIRRWTLVIYFYWFSVSLIYFALSLNAGTLAGDLFVNTLLLGLVEIPASLISFLALQRGLIGRRTAAVLSLVASGLAGFISIPLILDGSQPTLTTVFAILGKALAAMSFNIIYMLSAEVYPTEVRNWGMGTSSVCARISGMGAPYIGDALSDIWEPMPYLIYGIVGTLAGFLALLLPETLGKKLPQTIEEAVLLKRPAKKSKANQDVEGIDNKAFNKVNLGLKMDEDKKFTKL